MQDAHCQQRQSEERHREKHQVSYSRGGIIWYSGVVIHCPVPFQGGGLHVREVKMWVRIVLWSSSRLEEPT